jgi:NADH:ubiquinone oxidoreductase subunit 6 (subunit J)
MLINIFCGLVFFTLRFSRFNLTQPVWALLVYLLIVLFTGGVLWLRGFEFLTFILIIVVVGRLAVYFLITVLTYFKGDVREVPYFVSFVARYVNIPAIVGFYGVFLFFLRQLKMVG